MAKASLKTLTKGENEVREDWLRLGLALEDARYALKWTLDRLARELERDEKQVGRWIAGRERPQVERIMSVLDLDGEYAFALAERTGSVVERVVRRQRRIVA